MKRKWMAEIDDKNKRLSSQRFADPVVAPLSYRVRRKLDKLEQKYQRDESGYGIKRLVDEIESFCESEIDAGRITDSSQFWVAIYSHALVSVSAKINSFGGELALKSMRIGEGTPWEQAERAEVHRGLTRLKAEIERKLCRASEHVELAGSVDQKPGPKPRRTEQFVRRAGILWGESISGKTRVSDDQLLQIASALDADNYLPPADYLEERCAREVKGFNSRNSRSKIGPLLTWSQLVSYGDKHHLQGMRRMLSRCASALRPPSGIRN